MKQLRALREQRGWSGAELARRARVNPSTLCLIETGRLLPYAGQVSRLAKALGVRGGAVLHLLDDVDGPGDVACVRRKQAR